MNRAVAYRRNDRGRGTEVLGSLAVIAEVINHDIVENEIVVVTQRTWALVTERWCLSEFCKYYLPDCCHDALEVAHMYRPFCNGALTADDETRSLLDKITNDKTLTKEIAMNKKQPKGSHYDAVSVCTDQNRRLCFQYAEDGATTQFIELDPDHGIECHALDTKDFRRKWKPMSDYPADKAADLFVQYARNIGGSSTAMSILAQYATSLPEDDWDRAVELYNRLGEEQVDRQSAQDAKVAAKKAPSVRRRPDPTTTNNATRSDNGTHIDHTRSRKQTITSVTHHPVARRGSTSGTDEHSAGNFATAGVTKQVRDRHRHSISEQSNAGGDYEKTLGAVVGARDKKVTSPVSEPSQGKAVPAQNPAVDSLAGQRRAVVVAPAPLVTEPGTAADFIKTKLLAGRMAETTIRKEVQKQFSLPQAELYVSWMKDLIKQKYTQPKGK